MVFVFYESKKKSEGKLYFSLTLAIVPFAPISLLCLLFSPETQLIFPGMKKEVARNPAMKPKV